MLIYFNRPILLKNFKYTELFKTYVVNNSLPVRFQNRSETEGVLDGYFSILIQGLPTIYLCKRTDISVIMRLEMLYVTAGK